MINERLFRHYYLLSIRVTDTRYFVLLQKTIDIAWRASARPHLVSFQSCVRQSTNIRRDRYKAAQVVIDDIMCSDRVDVCEQFLIG